MYTVNVVISQKRCKIEMLLLQVTKSEWYTGMTYQIVAILMTLSDLQGHAPHAGLLKCSFDTVVQQLTRFQLS